MIKIKSPFHSKQKEKLVMTLLVKNESDIIVDNIFFHYAKGVDKIIVTDNGSTDGTLEILQHLSEKGLIHLLKAKLYNQDRIVNKMGQIAKDEYGATILMHSDADEFWEPVHENNLKRAFLKTGRISVLVDRKDVLPTEKSKFEDFPQHSMNMITKHLISDNVERDSKKISLFLYRLPPKVMFSVKEGLKNVGIGNHFLADMYSGEVTNDIIIFHFPFKSSKRFKEKVLMAGEVIETVKTTKETWWHWKKWYAQYKKGQLEDEIETLIPSLKTISGIKYQPFNYEEKILSQIRKNKKLRKVYESFKSEHQFEG